MRSIRTLLTVIGAAVVLALGANTVAVAATGHALILGKTNKARLVTTIKRSTGGPVLSLRAKRPTAAPLATNATGKVANLNADRLDGLDSSDLLTSTYTWTKGVVDPTDQVDVTLPLRPGLYVLGYDAYLVAGGTDDGTAGCVVLRNRSGETTYYAETREPTRTFSTPALSGSSVIEVAPGDDVSLTCFASKKFSTLTAEPIRIYAIRTTSAGGGELRAAPQTARVAH
jgi:hypothetical protein